MQDRRQLLRALGRWGLLGGIVWLSGELLRRRGTDCAAAGACTGCTRAAQCRRVGRRDVEDVHG